METSAEDDDTHLEVIGIKVENENQARWVDVLTIGDGQLEERFRQLVKQKGNPGSAIYWMRKQLFAEGRGMVDVELLKQAYLKGNIELLRNLAQEMFLEPITKGELQTILSTAMRNFWTGNDVQDIHNKDKEKRIWKIICCRNNNAVFGESFVALER